MTHRESYSIKGGIMFEVPMNSTLSTMLKRIVLKPEIQDGEKWNEGRRFHGNRLGMSISSDKNWKSKLKKIGMPRSESQDDK